jgi:hypothetical protein
MHQHWKCPRPPSTLLILALRPFPKRCRRRGATAGEEPDEVLAQQAAGAPSPLGLYEEGSHDRLGFWSDDVDNVDAADGVEASAGVQQASACGRVASAQTSDTRRAGLLWCLQAAARTRIRRRPR